MTELDETPALATAGGWGCPMPKAWTQLHQMLPDTRRQGAGGEPPLRLILGAWHHGADRQKADRRHKHLAWAAGRGALPRLHACLAALPDEAWRAAP